MPRVSQSCMNNRVMQHPTNQASLANSRADAATNNGYASLNTLQVHNIPPIGGAASGFQAYKPIAIPSADSSVFQALRAAVQLQQQYSQANGHALHQNQGAWNQPHPQRHEQQHSGPSSADDASQRANGHTQAADPNFAGVKLPIICNDIRGTAYLDQQMVACYCDMCSARVVAGHDRPLFSFTRFERHTGSKAKKWRLSLRIEPGVVKECPLGDQPMPLGQWLEMKGMLHWAPRTAVEFGVGDDYAASRQYLGQTVATSAMEPPMKRAREEYPTPDLPPHAPIENGLWIHDQHQKFNGAAQGNPSAKHAAIFDLVYRLLEAGGERRAFNEYYLPWLNEAGWQRIETEFATLHSYMKMLHANMDPLTVQSQMRGYVKGVISRTAGQMPS